ncbi:hypothetical protein ABT255_45930 [Streptomyces mirabilis]|uniref:hypothetical protein n=1 Tax=Streptomyces mirabilis TaxID=68239 RepID=UPI0033299454
MEVWSRDAGPYEEGTTWTPWAEREEAGAIVTEDQPQLPERPTQGHATASQAAPPRPQVPPVVTAEQWAAGFRQTHHRESTISEYQAAVQAGLIAPERRPRDPSMQLMADGAKQVVNGARDFFNTKVALAAENSGAKEFLSSRVAPAAQSAARSMQQSTSRPGLAKLRGLATFILPAAAFLAIISLFMPVASAVGFSVNYFMGSVSGTRYASVGAGVVLLALLSVVMLAAAVLIRLPSRQASAIPQMPQMPPTQPPQS